MRDAVLIGALESKPKAVWVTKGTPAEARTAVADTIKQAQRQRAVPVLVAYNVPGRDCGGLSAGGALTTADYKAWIDGVATGMGASRAIVILEPDGLGLLPSNCGAGYPFSDAQRYEELNYAVDKLGAGAQTSVYLDGTHSACLGVTTRRRHVGVRSTTRTGDPLADAFLWVKVPGESDGTCTRGLPAGSVDPEWGLVDPAAGHWFPEQALQLARLANPPLL